MLISLIVGVSHINVETRTLIYENEPGKPAEYQLFERIVSAKGISLITKTIVPGDDVSFAQLDFTLDGTPLKTRQEGQWNDRWNIFETTYSAHSATQNINGECTTTKMEASALRNPQVLWFWKTHPKIGDSTTVTFLAQNTIAKFKISFTYEADETLSLKGRKVTLHRVREKPLSAPDGVYTIWWYDDQGMGVKRYHKTTTSEFKTELYSWR